MGALLGGYTLCRLHSSAEIYALRPYEKKDTSAGHFYDRFLLQS